MVAKSHSGELRAIERREIQMLQLKHSLNLVALMLAMRLMASALPSHSSSQSPTALAGPEGVKHGFEQLVTMASAEIAKDGEQGEWLCLTGLR